MPGAGRFAPSPTGPLHLGSLLAATASYLDARRMGIGWQVRLDDLDLPRNEPGAEAAILRALECHGLRWDGPVVRQSEHLDRYAAALDSLRDQQRLFYCRCSRRELRGLQRYPGTCRQHLDPRPDSAVRLRVESAPIEFVDAVLGPQRADLATAPGDFVVRRRDGIIAYQLACAVDDGAPGITRVVRGRDLLHATAPQILLMGCLGLAVPQYGHTPLLVGREGRKLSKQNHAPPLDLTRPADNLAQVLTVLGHRPTEIGDCAAMLDQAARRFDLGRLSAIAPRVAGES